MADSAEDSEGIKIQFKKKSKKPLRRRQESSDESDAAEDGDFSSKLEEMKTLQKLRNRPNGVSVVSLALGQKVSNELDELSTDPFKVKTGGMINMKALKSGAVKKVDDAYDVGIGTQFSAETNKRDEDEEMMKYIEEQLSKKKKKVKEENEDRNTESNTDEVHKYMSPEEAALQAVPDHLRASTTHRSEEMLSNQMLSGIPEVDLGIDAKIRNIEATEEAKLKLLWERHNKKDGPSHFVPTNMAVNFVQFNRFNIDEPGASKQKWRGDQPAEKRKKSPVANKEGSKDEKRRDTATDDYHYEKFKKQFRRY